VLTCPLTVLYGTEDPVVDAATVTGWAELGQVGTTVRALPEGHFLLDAHYPYLVAE
jgi:surfactin synthase thioesterase subunit